MEEREHAAIPGHVILEELNAISLFCAERLQNLSDHDRKIQNTAITLALGALWMKWLEENPDEVSQDYIRIAAHVARSIRGIVTN